MNHDDCEYCCPCCGGDGSDCRMTPLGCEPKTDPDALGVDCDALDTMEGEVDSDAPAPLTAEQRAALAELQAADANATVTCSLLDRIARTMTNPAPRRGRSAYHG